MRAASAALAVFSSLPALAQAPVPPSFPGETALVVVDVVVRDKAGDPVRGLQREDFTVSEDGKPQPVVLFEPIAKPAAAATADDAAEAAPGTALRADGADDRPTLVIVFDEVHLSQISVEKARRRLIEAFAAGTPATADVLLASSAGGGTWRTRLPEERDDLEAALQRFHGKRGARTDGHMSDYEAFLIASRRDENVLIQVYRRYLDQGLLRDPTIPGLQPRMRGQQTDDQRGIPAIGRSAVSGEAEQIWGDARSRQQATLRTLSRLLEGLAGRPGRKTVLLISEGFSRDPNAVHEHSGLLEAARRARAAVHLVDPAVAARLMGSDVETSASIDSRDASDTLARGLREAEGAETVAAGTGGRVLRGLANLPDALSRIDAESRLYYLLGYAPPGPRNDGRYHQLTVAVRQPGVRVFARPGYYAIAPVRESDTRDAAGRALAIALGSPFDATTLPVRLASYVLGGSRDGRAPVRLVAELDASGAAVDAVFQLVARATGEAQTRVAAAAAGSAGTVRLEAGFEAPIGAHQAQVVVRERNGQRAGSLRTTVLVLPDAAFRASTPILTDILNGTPPGAVPVLRAERRFPRSGTLHCAVEALGASAQGPVLGGVQLQDGGGQVLQRVPLSPLPGDHPRRLWSLPLADLPPGAYELVISLRDAGSGQGLQLREPFEVVAN